MDTGCRPGFLLTGPIPAMEELTMSGRDPWIAILVLLIEIEFERVI